MLKILFIGDIIGKIGRHAVRKELPSLVKKYKPNFIIANAENMAHGLGVTRKTVADALDAGVQFFTSGNHIFDKKDEAEKVFADPALGNIIIRPANHKNKTGDGEKIIKSGKYKLLVINLNGRVFIKEEYESPFKTLDKILEKYKKEKLNGIFVDFHAEATSEKIALLHYAKERISALVGTHTHVPTADEQVFNKGTAYITDVGMTGAKNSIIGENPESIVKSYIEETKHKYEIADEWPAILNAVLIQIDTKTKKAKKIERIEKTILEK